MGAKEILSFLGGVFSSASNIDPAEEQKTENEKLERQQIKDDVHQNHGKVDPVTARRFMNIHYYEDRKSLAGLDLELKLNLYESLAEDSYTNMSSLIALNEEMGLTEEFYAEQAEGVRQFFSEENKGWLEARWKQQGFEGSFAEAMKGKLEKPVSLEDPENQNIIKFTIESFCEFTHQPPPSIKFEEMDYEGYYIDSEKTLYINISETNFLEAVDTAIHETRHGFQHELHEQYKAGNIARDDKDYIPARVFAANDSWYVSSRIDYAAYRKQPMEADSWNCGTIAQELVRKNYGPGIMETAATTVSSLARTYSPF